MDSVILVPQGAEYQAVCRGIQTSIHPPKVVSIPVGMGPVIRFLEQNQGLIEASEVIVMGLCGSLLESYPVGDAVLYEACVDASGNELNCDRTLSQRLQSRLQVASVRALTSDRVIWSAAEKRSLGQFHQASVVDMEGMAVLSTLMKSPIAMVRVVSDDAQHDLPDVTAAIADGKLQALPMAIAMARNPLGALRLIRGSLTGLNRLSVIAGEVAITLQA